MCAHPESMFAMPAGLGISTISPVQDLCCRLLGWTSTDDVVDRAENRHALGLSRPVALPKQPRELYVIAGKRAGKSLLAAMACIVWSQRVDVSGLMPGESFRIPVISLTKDLARQTYSHIRNIILASPWLRDLMVGAPTIDTLFLRHPTGRTCEIKVTAGARAGASVAARWLGGIVFDEAPRMMAAADSPINFDDMRSEAIGRILPGGALFAMGTPHAPFGPIYDVHAAYYGKPSESTVVVRAPSWVMNPIWWTPSRVEEARRDSPHGFLSDVAAEFADQEGALYAQSEIEEASRRKLPEIIPGRPYVAAMDPATRGNGWSLVVMGTYEVPHVTVVREWRGTSSSPLSPREVLREIAKELEPYGRPPVWTDRYMADPLRELAIQEGVTLIPVHSTQQETVERALALKFRMQSRHMRLCDSKLLREDLLRVRKHVTQTGVTLHLPETPDGRHCDTVPALLLCMRAALEMPKETRPKAGEAGFEASIEKQVQAQFERERRDAERMQRMPWLMRR